MTARLMLVSGTGTSIGKTHVAEALLRAWGRSGARIAGLKPIESGVSDDVPTDSARLSDASTFHVKHSGYRLRAPISPHLAARCEGIDIRLEVVVDAVEQARREADGVVVELPGGLFTPVGATFDNADLAVALRPDLLLLVAPDRLGVLHDVRAATRAATAVPLPIDGIVLVAPEHADDSSGTNAGELSAWSSVPVVAVLPRAPARTLSRLPEVVRLVDRFGHAGAVVSDPPGAIGRGF